MLTIFFYFIVKYLIFDILPESNFFFGQASSSSTEAGHWHDAGHFFTVLYSVTRTVESHSYYLQQPKKSILLFCHTSFSLAFPNHSCHLKEGLSSTIEHLSKDRDREYFNSQFFGYIFKTVKKWTRCRRIFRVVHLTIRRPRVDQDHTACNHNHMT